MVKRLISKKDKQGLSTVIVTLVIILISLIAIGIFWVVVNNLIKNSSENIGLSSLTLSAEIRGVSIDNSSNNISLIVKRNVGEGDLIGMKFVFYNNSDTEIISENFELQQLGEKSFVIHLSMNISTLTKISIAPIFGSTNGEENVGTVIDTFDVKTGKRIEIVNPPAGNQTGNQTCTPSLGDLCAGRNCGIVQNGTCGNISCAPGCSGGQTCNATGQCVSGACVPTTCAALGYTCGGPYNNGTCSGNLFCGIYGNGSCQSGYNCISGTCVMQMNGSYIQNFEGSTFPPTGWTTGGNSNWFRNTTEPDSGTASAASGKINGSQVTWLSYSHPFANPGNVSFLWNVSSEVGYDFVCFCVDKVCGDVGCTCGAALGTADIKWSSSTHGVWAAQNVIYPINTSGVHNLTWCYGKDGGVDYGADMAKLDEVMIN